MLRKNIDSGMTQRWPALLAIALLMPASRAALAAGECAAPAVSMARVELLFGTTLEGGVALRDDEWRRFVDEEVTKRFPEGLTELAGHGQWRRPDGQVGREPSRVLLIWYTPSTHGDADIEAIRERYKKRFKQLSVMRVDGADCVSF